jgi:hypothetical protein
MGSRFQSLGELWQHMQRPIAVALACHLGQKLVEWSASGFTPCEGDELTKRLVIILATPDAKSAGVLYLSRHD